MKTHKFRTITVTPLLLSVLLYSFGCSVHQEDESQHLQVNDEWIAPYQKTTMTSTEDASREPSSGSGIKIPTLLDMRSQDEESGDQGARLLEVKELPEVTWSAENRQEDILLEEGGLVARVDTHSVNNTILATAMTRSSKWYWEVTVEASSGDSFNGIGICPADLVLEFAPGYRGGVNYSRNGLIEDSSMDFSLIEAPRYGVGDTIGVAMDAEAGRAWFRVGEEWIGSGSPELGRGGIELRQGGDAPWAPCINLSQNDRYLGNFGQFEWVYSVPEGFSQPSLDGE